MIVQLIKLKFKKRMKQHSHLLWAFQEQTKKIIY